MGNYFLSKIMCGFSVGIYFLSKIMWNFPWVFFLRPFLLIFYSNWSQFVSFDLTFLIFSSSDFLCTRLGLRAEEFRRLLFPEFFSGLLFIDICCSSGNSLSVVTFPPSVLESNYSTWRGLFYVVFLLSRSLKLSVVPLSALLMLFLFLFFVWDCYFFLCFR